MGAQGASQPQLAGSGPGIYGNAIKHRVGWLMRWVGWGSVRAVKTERLSQTILDALGAFLSLSAPSIPFLSPSSPAYSTALAIQPPYDSHSWGVPRLREGSHADAAWENCKPDCPVRPRVACLSGQFPSVF